MYLYNLHIVLIPQLRLLYLKSSTTSLTVDNGDAAVLALLDQSSVFDTIDHSILSHRLNALFGIAGAVYSWFSSYLSGRFQSVCISGVTSAAVLLSFGVPQGSVLGPVLFTLYNSPIHSISLKHGVVDHYYADDDQKYVSFSIGDSNSGHADQQKAFSQVFFLHRRDEGVDGPQLHSAE